MRVWGPVCLLASATTLLMSAVCCGTFGSTAAGDASDAGAGALDGPGGPTSDGGGDAGTARFCASINASFCADFDGTDYLEGWTLQTAAAASTLDDTTSFVSPPASASISGSLIVGATTFGRLAHTLPGSPLEIVAEARLRLTVLPPGATVIPISLRFGSAANEAMRFEVGLEQGVTGLLMFETVHTYPLDAGPQMSGTLFPYGGVGGFDGWTPVRLKVSLNGDGGAGTATFRVGSGPDKTINLHGDTGAFAPPLTLVIGLVKLVLADAGTAQVSIDNVVVNAP
jgi:hypothetical protein